jgi:pSer/pThr/pTyr-binding forkhead associated (FHA) protein
VSRKNAGEEGKMAQQISFILKDARTGQEYPVSPGGLRIGRTSQNDVVLSDDKASRHHATLWAQDDQLYIRDENSTNGTWVNEERIAIPKVMQAGDRLRIGDTVFEVTTSAEPISASEAVIPAPAAFPVVPVAIGGGIVLVILIALIIRGVGKATALPTATPTLVLTPTETIAPTEVPTVQPTRPSVRTPTRVAPSVPQAVSLELVAPAQGVIDQLNPITFRWRGSLSGSQVYQVTAYHPESGERVGSGPLAVPTWTTNLPAERYGEWRWTVSVVQNGNTVTTSDEWMFWFNPFPRTEEPPQPEGTHPPHERTPTPDFRP